MKWINIEDELPKEGVEVLIQVYNPSFNSDDTFYALGNYKNWWHNIGCCNVICWSYIEPPITEDK